LKQVLNEDIKESPKIILRIDGAHLGSSNRQAASEHLQGTLVTNRKNYEGTQNEVKDWSGHEQC
jgi:hypothetical protein